MGELTRLSAVRSQLRVNTQVEADGNWARCGRCGGEYPTHALNDATKCKGCVQEERQLAQRVISLFKSEHAAKRYALEGYSVTAENREAFEAVRDFDPKSSNLYLFGPCGVGKTHLAFGAARNMVLASKSVALFKSFELVRSLRGLSGYEEQREIDRIVSSQVCVVDEIGIENSTDFTLRILYEIVDARDMAGRNGLIVTSNLSLDDLAKKSGDDRLPSRLAGMCRIIQMSGEDYRLR